MSEARADDSFVVGAVLSTDSDLYRGALSGLHEGLTSSSSRQISVRAVILDDESGSTRETDRAARLNGVDVIVSIGTQATEWSLANGLDHRLMSILMPVASVVGLAPELTEKQAQHTTFLVIDQPLDRQIRLGRIIAPQASSLGVLLGPSTSELEPELAIASELAGFDLNAILVNNTKEANRAVSSLARMSDILLAIYDPEAVNRHTLRALLYAAYSWHRPTVGFSAAFTRAGGLAAVFSRPENIGRDAGERIARMADGEQVAWGALLFPKYFSVAVNRNVARSLKLNLPSDSELQRALAE